MPTTTFNRVKFLAVSGGTGSFTVDVATLGFNTPAERGVANSTSVSYTAEYMDALQWETGRGVYSAGVLTRIIRENSLGTTAAVNFAAPPTVWFDWHAQELEDFQSLGHVKLRAADGQGSQSGFTAEFVTGDGAGGGDGGSLDINTGFGNSAGSGGSLTQVAGDGGEDGDGGDVEVRSGAGGSATGRGGNMSVTAGAAGFDGEGGILSLSAGAGRGTGKGGNINIISGGGLGSGNGGDIDIQPGNAVGAGRRGLIFLNLPVVDPLISGALWNDGGTVKVSV